jgi:ribosome-associated translation inhibitor RaiA
MKTSVGSLRARLFQELASRLAISHLSLDSAPGHPNCDLDRPKGENRSKNMQVLVNSDHHITGDLTMTQRVESIVGDAVDRFADRVTRVEVHLNDVNGAKHGAKDKRCMMEARVGGLKPLAVSHEAPTLLEAIEACADKLERALAHTLGRLQTTSRSAAREVDIVDVEALDALEKNEPPPRGHH